jgi:hypothetical protein
VIIHFLKISRIIQGHSFSYTFTIVPRMLFLNIYVYIYIRNQHILTCKPPLCDYRYLNFGLVVAKFIHPRTVHRISIIIIIFVLVMIRIFRTIFIHFICRSCGISNNSINPRPRGITEYLFHSACDPFDMIPQYQEFDISHGKNSIRRELT